MGSLGGVAYQQQQQQQQQSQQSPSSVQPAQRGITPLGNYVGFDTITTQVYIYGEANMVS